MVKRGQGTFTQPFGGEVRRQARSIHMVSHSDTPNCVSKKLLEQSVVLPDRDLGDQAQVPPMLSLSDQLQEGERITTYSLCDTDFFIQKHEVKSCLLQRGHSSCPLCPAPDSQNP